MRSMVERAPTRRDPLDFSIRSRASGAVGALCLLILCGCTEELSGPAPSFSGEPGTSGAPLEPGFVCSDLQDMWVEVRGAGFSPLVTGALDEGRGAVVLLPLVRLSRSGSVEGEPGGDAFEVVLASTGDENTPLRWLDSGLMEIKVGASLDMPAGLYDLEVSNANGKRGEQAGAFGVVEAPVASGAEASVCAGSRPRQVVLTGDHFVAAQGELPTVTINGRQYLADGADDCRPIAAVFGERALCRSLTVSIPLEDLTPDQSTVEISAVTNAGSTGCSSDLQLVARCEGAGN